MPKRKYLYHGTSLRQWKTLLEKGCTDLLYLADNPDDPWMYAEEAVHEDDAGAGEGIVIRWPLQLLLANGKLMPDWTDVATNMELFPGATSAEEVSWKESLRRLHTCSYCGPLHGGVVVHREMVEF